MHQSRHHHQSQKYCLHLEYCPVASTIKSLQREIICYSIIAVKLIVTPSCLASISGHATSEDDEVGADPTYTLFHVRGEDSMSEPVTETMLVNGANLEMEVDTGAACSVISAMTYQESWPKDQAPPLYSTKKKLCTYTGEPLQIKGAITVRACYQAETAELELLVVAGTGPSLLGRDWLRTIRLDWESLNRIWTVNAKALTHQTNILKFELELVEARPSRIHRHNSVFGSSSRFPMPGKGGSSRDSRGWSALE